MATEKATDKSNWMLPSPAAAAGGGKSEAAPVKELADRRLIQVVIALVPEVGEVQPSQMQEDLAMAMQGLVDAAVKQQQQQPPADKGMVDEASARFFSADVIAAEQKKAAEKEATKEQKGQAAAGQPVTPAK